MKKTVYICDLCGKEYSYGGIITPDGNLYADTVDTDGFCVPGVHQAYMKLIVFKTSADRPAADLCEDCQLEIAEAMVKALKKMRSDKHDEH